MLNDPYSHGVWESTAPPSPASAELRDEVTANVAVIGGGYTGLSTALHLCKRGTSVVVLEAVDIGFGGSGRNVGLVNAGLWVMPKIVLARIGEVYGERLLGVLGAAPRLVFDLIAAHAIDCHAVRAGTLHCAVGDRGLVELEERAAQWKALGAPVELLSAAEAAGRIGTSAFSGALFDARAGTVHPLAYVRGLAAAAMDHGARVFIRTPALDAVQSTGAWTISTPTGCVRAQWVVVATDVYSAGPWQRVQTEQIRLPYCNFATPPLESSLRGSILPRQEGAWDTRRVLSSFRLDAAGRLVFGSVGALRGGGVRVHGAWARRELRKVFPQLRDITFEAAWYGQIGMTTDNLPRFHAFAPNMIGFCGYNGRGIAPGTAFGRMLADLIHGELTFNDLPLPVTTPEAPAFRAIRERFYELGSKVLHIAGARF